MDSRKKKDNIPEMLKKSFKTTEKEKKLKNEVGELRKKKIEDKNKAITKIKIILKVIKSRIYDGKRAMDNL